MEREEGKKLSKPELSAWDVLSFKFFSLEFVLEGLF